MIRGRDVEYAHNYVFHVKYCCKSPTTNMATVRNFRSIFDKFNACRSHACVSRVFTQLKQKNNDVQTHVELEICTAGFTYCFHLRLGLPNDLFPSGFSPKTSMHLFSGPRCRNRDRSSLRTGRSGERISEGAEVLNTHPGRPSGLPALLYNGCRVSFQGVKRQGHGVNYPPPT